LTAQLYFPAPYEDMRLKRPWASVVCGPHPQRLSQCAERPSPLATKAHKHRRDAETVEATGPNSIPIGAASTWSADAKARHNPPGPIPPRRAEAA